MVRDPVCGMEFSEEEAEGLGAEKVRHEGGDVYFCCPVCRDAFLADPGKYSSS